MSMRVSTFVRYIGWTVVFALFMVIVVLGILAWVFDLHD